MNLETIKFFNGSGALAGSPSLRMGDRRYGFVQTNPDELLCEELL